MDKQKIIQSIKIMVAPVFAILAVWGVNTGAITEDVITQLITIIGAIIAGGVSTHGFQKRKG